MEDGEEELARSTMEGMIKDAISKSRGNAPSNISELLELWSRKPVISWKKVLKKYLSSKKGSKRRTIKRRDRRLPNRLDIKGKITHYDTPEVIVGVDVSGSMSSEDIYNGLKEIAEVCRISNGSLKLAQIDTEIKELETFDEKKKDWVRKGCGGTYMGDMPRYLMEKKLNCDVLIMISDMFIEDVSTDKYWSSFKKPVIWLNTSGNKMDVPRTHKVFDISDA
jgi:predicted metal-dependent peptidase